MPLLIHTVRLTYRTRVLGWNLARLGSYLGAESTIMPRAGYANFNTWADGNNMIEGGLSSGATIGRHTQLGGGSSLQGIIAGGKEPIVIGQRCLLGATSSVGISLGDGCIVQMGNAVAPGMSYYVNVLGHPLYGHTVKAQSLSGIHGVTFIQNSSTGRREVIVIPDNFARLRLIPGREDIVAQYGGSVEDTEVRTA